MDEAGTFFEVSNTKRRLICYMCKIAESTLTCFLIATTDWHIAG